MSEREGTLTYEETIFGKHGWNAHLAVDADYKPPKQLWWSMHGPDGQTLVLPRTFSKKQVNHVAIAFNEAEKMGEKE